MHSAILVGGVSGVRVDLVPDDLWERVAPLLPPAPERRRLRRLRDWTESGVRRRLHATLLTELRRAGLLHLDDCSVGGSHVRALISRRRNPL